jgi:hypothetical protein
MVGSAREGVWADDPDLRAFRQLIEDLQARGPSLARRRGTASAPG